MVVTSSLYQNSSISFIRARGFFSQLEFHIPFMVRFAVPCLPDYWLILQKNHNQMGSTGWTKSKVCGNNQLERKSNWPVVLKKQSVERIQAVERTQAVERIQVNFAQGHGSVPGIQQANISIAVSGQCPFSSAVPWVRHAWGTVHAQRSFLGVSMPVRTERMTGEHILQKHGQE